MNIIKKMILFLKKLFIKQDEVKKITEPKVAVKQEKTDGFIETLKATTTTEKTTKKRVETLVCDGDGLGIKKDMTY